MQEVTQPSKNYPRNLVPFSRLPLLFEQLFAEPKSGMYAHQLFGNLTTNQMFSPSMNNENEVGFNGRTPVGFDHVMEEGGRVDMGMSTWINAPVIIMKMTVSNSRMTTPMNGFQRFDVRLLAHSTLLFFIVGGTPSGKCLILPSCRKINLISTVFVRVRWQQWR